MLRSSYSSYCFKSNPLEFRKTCNKNVIVLIYSDSTILLHLQRNLHQKCAMQIGYITKSQTREADIEVAE